jgi:hypothetical protein
MFFERASASVAMANMNVDLGRTELTRLLAVS